MRYEEDFLDEAVQREELLRKFDREYGEIMRFLEQSLRGTDQEYCIGLLRDLISLVIHAILPDDGELRKEVSDIMGGHPISTPSTILMDRGIEIGLRQGIMRGMKRGIEQGTWSRGLVALQHQSAHEKSAADSWTGNGDTRDSACRPGKVSVQTLRCYILKVLIDFLFVLIYNAYMELTVLQSGRPPFIHRMEVMRMKNLFDFNDLIQFGLFILALLTFIYLICH